tara:strand:- start:165 stop:494 length:330 start_codon:yes stop_codon:yes gene_type:complete
MIMMFSVRPVLHGVLHVAAPVALAVVAWRSTWRRAAAIMLATLVVDLDHLLADPIYDPDRCSIGTHLLHTPVPIVIYVLLAAWPKSRLVGVGLLLHMLLDGVDCWFMRH